MFVQLSFCWHCFQLGVPVSPNLHNILDIKSLELSSVLSGNKDSELNSVLILHNTTNGIPAMASFYDCPMFVLHHINRYQGASGRYQGASGRYQGASGRYQGASRR